MGGTANALCRPATGGSLAVRRLYTDADEMLFQAARPIVLNGIEDAVIRPDLADRAIFLTLPPVGEGHRRSETELWREFELTRPRILGALLDAVAHGLQRLSTVGLERPPRMADFAIWASACETAFWPSGTFMRAYEANRRAAIVGMIDADPVATCIREIMATRATWAGTASDLLELTERSTDGLAGGNASWRVNPRALAGRLRRAQPPLRSLGIEIAFSREGREGRRVIRMQKITCTDHSDAADATAPFVSCNR